MTRQRNATIDVARGFTVFIMPAVHSVLTYSTTAVQTSMLGKFLGFLAEGPGAELFMLLMGISIVLGKKKSPKEIGYRSLQLLGLAYLLNFFKIILPLCWHGIPMNVFTENQIPYDLQGWFLLFQMGDILQLAAIAYFVCSIIYRQKRYFIWAIGFGLFMNFITPFMWKIQVQNVFLQVPFHLICGMPPNAFFPAFPWIVYPLLGLGIGAFISSSNSKRFYSLLFLAGLVLVFIGKLIIPFEPIEWETDFYRLGPGGTLYHAGIAFMWLCLCYLSVKYIKGSWFFTLLTWLSKHITAVYCVQWIVIFWLSPLFSYHHLGLFGSLFSILFTTVLSFSLVYMGLMILEKRKQRNNKTLPCTTRQR
ncbi:heparan-alpha-glucosaminide N-acetyltransferase domain-containing protein [Arachidicoccus soli]|uniref:DUF1624 domain-containing protein n=1 Tax=Arachidicoccus soli TaxID=2341117 RepID=A0A386HNK9_9BACT|nr:heparan-alpha-glucosaminide N-acetyltransferase domain-containing protein [Arachidicoccus soli]AYD47405.1 DUF1624 domain-containing protein [Arachidicoccus soli]